MDNLNEEEKQFIADCLWSVKYNELKPLTEIDNKLYIDVMRKLYFAKVGN